VYGPAVIGIRGIIGPERWVDGGGVMPVICRGLRFESKVIICVMYAAEHTPGSPRAEGSAQAREYRAVPVADPKVPVSSRMGRAGVKGY